MSIVNKVAQDSFLDSITKSIHDAIIMINAKGLIVFWNTAAEKMLQYKAEEILGKNYHDLIAPKRYLDAHRKAFASFQKDGQGAAINQTVELEATRKDGEEISVELSLSSIKGEDGWNAVGILRDITDRKKSEVELKKYADEMKKSLEYQKGLFKNSTVGILFVTGDRIISDANPLLLEIFGYEREELIGKSVRIMHASEETYEQFGLEYYSKTANNKNVSVEYQFKRKSGEIFWVSISGRALDNDDLSKGVVWALRDISNRKKVEQEVTRTNEKLIQVTARANEMAKKAEAANIAKSQFLANMSHEIRTPMNAVVGMSDLLMDTSLTAKQKEYVSIIIKSADSLLNLINDILDYSKIEADRLDIESIDFDLRNLLEDVVDILALRAQEKELEFVSFIPMEVPTYLKGDPGRLRQIITNLVNNAIKFTKKGEVGIKVSVMEETDDHAKLKFSVQDTGIGLSSDEKKMLFQPFMQADASTTRKYGGTGLGLSISKKLAELMDGEIGVISEKGEGSKFWFTAKFAKQPDQAIPESDFIPGDIRDVRILAVDDNESNRKVIGNMLENWGCRFDLAENGKVALERLHGAMFSGDPFGLVILDMAMPEMDGKELGSKILESDNLKKPSLVMLTSVGQRGDAEALHKMGFDAYLTKPIKQSQLYDCLVKVIGKKAGLKPDPSSDRLITRHTLAEERIFKLRGLLVEDNVFNQMVAKEILGKLGLEIEVADNGRIAVDILANTDFDLVFMDMQMPEMDGIEATRYIRDTNSPVRNHAIPIVAMTANAMKGDRELCLEAGMDDYVAKPINRKELIRALERIDHNIKTKDPILGVEAESENIDEADIFNETELLDRLSGDQELVKTILNAFVLDVSSQIERLDNLLNDHALEDAQRQAHSIKGAAGNAGATALQKLAATIEQNLKEQNAERALELFPQLGQGFQALKALLVKKGLIDG